MNAEKRNIKLEEQLPDFDYDKNLVSGTVLSIN
jgi:hypothetical protein